MKEPLVSVIMPSYNAKYYIEESIKSILRQTYQNFELIIIDDLSTDGTWRIVQDITDERCRKYSNDKNYGIAYTRNRAIEMAKGKYLAFMDDDDVAITNRIAKEVEFLEHNIGIDIVGGKAQICYEDLRPRSYVKEIWYNPNLIKVAYLFQSVMYNSTVMMRKSVIEDSNIFFRNNCYGMEDYDFYMRCSKVANMTNLDEVFLKYRMHDKSETARVHTNDNEKRIIKYASIQRESFLRSGFVFKDDEWEEISDLLVEGGLWFTERDIKRMMDVLKRIMFLAKNIEFKYMEELEYYCRWRLAKAVEKSNYWLQ